MYIKILVYIYIYIYIYIYTFICIFQEKVYGRKSIVSSKKNVDKENSEIQFCRQRRSLMHVVLNLILESNCFLQNNFLLSHFGYQGG